MLESCELVIGGATEPGERGTYEVANPVRPAETVLLAPAASADQLDRAVGAARLAAPAWAALTPEARADALHAAAAAAMELAAADDLGRLLTREHGKPLWEAQFDIGTVGGMAGAFAPLAADVLRPRTLGEGSARTEVTRVPHGVVAAVLPFNWPVSVMGNKVLPALLTGNTVVAKSPPTCPGAVLAIGAALASALPPGVLNVVNGPDAELGQMLVAHPGIDMISFTGGVGTGRAVMAAAAAATTPVVLELGGNDPAVVAGDVEFDDALADKIVSASFVTSGQVCMAVKRLYVQWDRMAEAVEALADRLSREVVGDGLADEVTMGPVHRAAARDRAEALVAAAEGRGARIHRPGRLRDADRGSGGYLVSPALVESPPQDAEIVTGEQFAPVLPILGYGRLDEAVAAANATPYGLCASMWTNDEELGAATAARLQAGTVFLNDHGMSAMDFRAPMGGWKASGVGLELGPEGMEALTRPRVIRHAPGGRAAP